jgi:hypothetical protein
VSGERPPSGRRDRLRVGPAEGRFGSPLHGERSATLLGLAIAVAFTVCFATGLLSHFISPRGPDWAQRSWPASPAWLYRVTEHDAACEHEPAAEAGAGESAQQHRGSEVVVRDVVGDVGEVDTQADHRREMADVADALDCRAGRLGARRSPSRYSTAGLR